jgi:heme/copper-type cytochrome/quinol oxidase subunit 4
MSHVEQTHDLHPSDTAPGEQRIDRADITEQIKSYLIGLGLAILLTITSFFISGTTLVWGPSIPVALIVLAIAQMGFILSFSSTSRPAQTTSTMSWRLPLAC